MANMRDFVMTIDGRSVTTDGRLPVVNPATEEVFAHAPHGSPGDVDAAVAAAKAAFPAWAALPLAERQRYLRAIGDCIAEHRDELIEILIHEQGKPRGNASGEVDGSIYWCHALSEQDIPVQVIEDSAERSVEVHHLPLGVVAAISAWNYPLMIVAFKIAPALLAGNTLVVKPSPFTPLATLRLGELLQPILPPGVVNVVSGEDDIGPALTSHPDVAKISFTGSTATGRKIMQSASATLKRLTLELGGNDAAIVLPDVDIGKTVEALFWGAFQNSGQLCVAAKRIYVHADIYDAFLAAFVAFADGVPLGSGVDPAVKLGPVQNRMQYDKVRGLIASSREAGHRFALGGEERHGPGFFVPVTVIDNPPDDAAVVTEEAFGPVVPFLKFADVDEAIARANDSPFGLAASIWTKDWELARGIAGRLETGTVWINEIHSMSPDRVFAGRKQSGLGAEHGLAGLLEFTSPQAVVINKAA
ncbi:aldehyde dehydrogenase family protein [Sphingomonas naphthae]|uniref:Aldehyde dehydrogenase family protein n=1 Tax=Sphingomonas naphthae TaxID=1813468 RepID=A0ABY7TMW2_9SPHN|nr:aldehyde dehydrogenase family protein [Sphingomonas naphthae]WCT74524.1 aldehyde dehydrogenase family protein [Sphingomonas naphthae]